MPHLINLIIYLFALWGSAPLNIPMIPCTRKYISAIQTGTSTEVQRLLDAGVSVNAVLTENGSTPLHLAAFDGKTKIAQLLLERGAQVNARTTDGTTPLSFAAQTNHLEVAQLLLERGAQVNARTTSGATPLLIAAEMGHLEVAQLLLDRGAQVNVRTTDGTTPLFIAAEMGHLEVARLLLDYHAQVDAARTTDGTTSLYISVQNSHLAVVQLLLDHGAQVNKARTDNGATPLFVAAQTGHLAVAQLLLDHGAQVNKAHTDNGVTPLFIAAQNDHSDLVTILLIHGADPDIRNYRGKRAVDYATSPEIKKIFYLISAIKNHDVAAAQKALPASPLSKLNHDWLIKLLALAAHKERMLAHNACSSNCTRCAEIQKIQHIMEIIRECVNPISLILPARQKHSIVAALAERELGTRRIRSAENTLAATLTTPASAAKTTVTS